MIKNFFIDRYLTDSNDTLYHHEKALSQLNTIAKMRLYTRKNELNIELERVDIELGYNRVIEQLLDSLTNARTDTKLANERCKKVIDTLESNDNKEYKNE